MTTVYLGLGSNLGDREANLRRAADLIQARRTSSIYETEPMYVTDQPRFLNMVAEVETGLDPHALLRRTLAIEREMGRERTVPKGPRTIDIDILFYGDLVMETDELVIPHPRLTERRFVLEPLADLAPGLRHPLLGRTVAELLDHLTRGGAGSELGVDPL